MSRVNKVCLFIGLLAFLLAPALAGAEEYGSPAPLDPVFMQGISGGPIKPLTIRPAVQAGKPQAGKPGSNKPRINNNKPGGSKPRAVRR